METLQLAQMLADLSSLNAAEPNAAAALVTANKAIEKVERNSADTNSIPRRPTDELRRANSSQGFQRIHTGSSSASPSPAAGGGSAARVDRFGRRILMSPPLTRTNSAQASGAATPRRDSDGEDDLDRATTLMALYDIRAKLKQQDNSSLLKAREKIADLAARQQGRRGQPGAQAPAPAPASGKREPARYAYPK